MKKVRQHKIAVLGAGMMGTTLSVLVAEKGYNVTLWARRRELCEKMLKLGENPDYYPGIKLLPRISPTNDLAESVNNAGIVFIAVPSHAVPEVAKKVSNVIPRDAIIVNVAKGISYPPPKLLSEILIELGLKNVAVMSGPNFAYELIRKTPSITVLASKDARTLKVVSNLLKSNSLLVKTTKDIVGVQVGGVMKGIISIAIGIADALEMGDNVRGLLFTEGVREMMELCRVFGGKIETILGPAGLGDLASTAFSLKSRNRAIGYMLGFGLSFKTLDDAIKERIVVEGTRSLMAIKEIAEEKGCTFPVVDTLYEILYNNKPAKSALYELCTKKIR